MLACLVVRGADLLGSRFSFETDRAKIVGKQKQFFLSNKRQTCLLPITKNSLGFIFLGFLSCNLVHDEYRYVCVCARARALARTCAYLLQRCGPTVACMLKSEENLGYHSLHSTFIETPILFCCCCLLLHIPGQLAGKPLEIASLPPCRRRTGLTDIYYYTEIYMILGGGFNSAPPNFMAALCPLLLFLRQSLTMHRKLTWNSRLSCLKQLRAGTKVLYCCHTHFPSFLRGDSHANKGNAFSGVGEQQWTLCGQVSKIKPQS